MPHRPHRPTSIQFAAIVLLGALAACQSPLKPGPPENDVAPPQFAVSGSGTTYYVSPTGSDTNVGTSITKPWKTLAKVTGQSFAAGDSILLQGGAVFSGTLALDSQDKGSATYPIVVSSYGVGRAIVDAGTGGGVFVYNTAGVVIKNLVVQGSGRTVNTGSGVSAYMDLAGGVKLDYLLIDSVETSGFGKVGIEVGSWNGSSGFRNVTIANSSSHDNALSGVMTYAQAPSALQNVVVRRVTAYNNTGKAGLTSPSGNGIVLGGVSGGLIERSVAHDNGALCDAPGGPVGIWAYDSHRITIQYNESYRNRTAGTADGGGFDLDQNTKNSTIQYNYSHQNDGAGFLLSQSPNNTTHTGNLVRYNISENDARKNSYGAIMVYGKVRFAEVYNNTVFLSPAPVGSPRGIIVHNYTITANDVRSLHVRNNIFYSTGGLRTVEVTSGQINGAVDLRFEGNDYYGGTVAPKIVWGSATHRTLATWRSATGQELLSGVPLGMIVGPGLANAGAGGTIGNADKLTTLAAYRLVSSSPLIDRGLDLLQRFGLSVGSTDFYGLTLPSGSGFDVGANEWR